MDVQSRAPLVFLFHILVSLFLHFGSIDQVGQLEDGVMVVGHLMKLFVASTGATTL